MATPYRILSIDGGGIRGILPATVLAALEREAGKPVSELFDLIAGTSTGGILALALTVPGADGRPKFTAAEVADSYATNGPEIFSRTFIDHLRTIEGLADERYRSTGLQTALERYFGDTHLHAALTDVLLTSYDTNERDAFFFRSSRSDRPGWDWPMAVAGRATAAAPTYFEPVRLTTHDGAKEFCLIDGGVVATNPAMCAIAETLTTNRDTNITMLSLGTGRHTRTLPWTTVHRWGLVEWARPLVDIIVDGGADTVHFQAQQILGDSYRRIQADIPPGTSDALDDARPRNIQALRDLGDATVVREMQTITDMAKLLER